MEERINYVRVAPHAISPMMGLEDYVRRSGLEESLVNLVKLRASQIDGCAYCIDQHTKDARAMGESEQRLYELNAWREAPFYTDRERAALAWTEAVTLIADAGVEDEVYKLARQQFSEKELVDLTMAIIAINGWNRLSISFHYPPVGSYQPSAHRERAAA